METNCSAHPQIQQALKCLNISINCGAKPPTVFI